MYDLYNRYTELKALSDDIESALSIIGNCFAAGGKLLLCGNGGSASDCDHIVGELMKGFMKKRRLDENKRTAMKSAYPDIESKVLDLLQCGLPAISLPSAVAFNTAFANDESAELIYAQGIMALGKKGDTLLCISTSGNSSNVVYAAEVAVALGVRTVALTGAGGGRLGKICECCIAVPERETYLVQQLHLPIYHYLCARLEERFFS